MPDTNSLAVVWFPSVVTLTKGIKIYYRVRTLFVSPLDQCTSVFLYGLETNLKITDDGKSSKVEHEQPNGLKWKYGGLVRLHILLEKTPCMR